MPNKRRKQNRNFPTFPIELNPIHIIINFPATKIDQKKKGSTFPEPKNPVIMVAGIRLSGGILVETSEVSPWDVGAAVDETVNLRKLLFSFAKSRAMSVVERNDDVE